MNNARTPLPLFRKKEGYLNWNGDQPTISDSGSIPAWWNEYPPLQQHVDVDSKTLRRLSVLILWESEKPHEISDLGVIRQLKSVAPGMQVCSAYSRFAITIFRPSSGRKS